MAPTPASGSRRDRRIQAESPKFWRSSLVRAEGELISFGAAEGPRSMTRNGPTSFVSRYGSIGSFGSARVGGLTSSSDDGAGDVASAAYTLGSRGDRA